MFSTGVYFVYNGMHILLKLVYLKRAFEVKKFCVNRYFLSYIMGVVGCLQ